MRSSSIAANSSDELSDGNYADAGLSFVGDVGLALGVGAGLKFAQASGRARRMRVLAVGLDAGVAGVRTAQGIFELQDGQTRRGIGHLGEATLMLIGLGAQAKQLRKLSEAAAAKRADKAQLDSAARIFDDAQEPAGQAARRASDGSSPSEKLPSNALRQTGSGFFAGSADESYDAIRASTSDVAAISRNTGIKPENIQKVKNHLFHQEHLLDRYVDLGVPAEMRRFDSDLGIANAWKRLEQGTHTAADLQLLRHEAAESFLMRRWDDPSYTRAHTRAEQRYPAPRLDR